MPVTVLGICDQATIAKRIFESPHTLHIADSDQDNFKAGDTFESFHHQAGNAISEKALLAGYLMLWLKRCVVPSSTNFDMLVAEVIYPAVCLAYGRPYSLLTAMIACTQSGLRKLTHALCLTRVSSDGEGGEIVWSPNPRVGLPYTYLMAWFVLHCPGLMNAPEAIREDLTVPFLQRLEMSSWTHSNIVEMRKTLRQHANFTFYRTPPRFAQGSYGDMFQDSPTTDMYSVLSTGCFR